jgi:hypothetical protein
MKQLKSGKGTNITANCGACFLYDYDQSCLWANSLKKLYKAAIILNKKLVHFASMINKSFSWKWSSLYQEKVPTSQQDLKLVFFMTMTRAVFESACLKCGHWTGQTKVFLTTNNNVLTHAWTLKLWNTLWKCHCHRKKEFCEHCKNIWGITHLL